MKKKLWKVFGLIFIIFIVVFVLWYYGIIIFNAPSKKYEVKGVDVSAYQGDIDWNLY